MGLELDHETGGSGWLKSLRESGMLQKAVEQKWCWCDCKKMLVGDEEIEFQELVFPPTWRTDVFFFRFLVVRAPIEEVLIDYVPSPYFFYDFNCFEEGALSRARRLSYTAAVAYWSDPTGK